MKQKLRGWPLLAAVLLLDRLSKAFAVRMRGDVILLPGFLRLHTVENTGAAFSLGAGRQTSIILLSFAVLAALAYLLLSKELSRRPRTALLLILGGGLGNLADRILSGSVTDFIALDFIDFPVFNAADICICLGALLLLLTILFDKKAK